jgi:hypothetical protein
MGTELEIEAFSGMVEDMSHWKIQEPGVRWVGLRKPKLASLVLVVRSCKIGSGNQLATS